MAFLGASPPLPPSLTASVCPGAYGGSLTARTVDAEGQEHVFRAGNFLNPLVLEWGGAYLPRRLDIGGGVFAIREGPGGRTELVLIGVQLGPSLNRGMASLVSSGMPWVANALLDAETGSKSDEVSRLNLFPPGR